MSWEKFCDLNKVGLRYRDAKLSECELPQEIMNHGLVWSKKPRSLLLTGGAGTGKTYFSYCLSREAVESFGIGCLRWMKSKAIDDKIIESTSKFGSASYLLENLCEIPILVIDDFGVDRATERAERDYYEIIDKRWENMKPTVISTNLDRNQIEQIYGARIFSRLKSFTWLLFDGPDLREKT